MTQTNNEREALIQLLNEMSEFCMMICNSKPEEKIKGAIESKAFYIGHHPFIINPESISQSEQQEGVAIGGLSEFAKAPIGRILKNGEIDLYDTQDVLNEMVGFEVYIHPHSPCKSDISPPKQAIQEGWKPIETVPKDGTQVIIKCSGGRVATAFYDDKPFVGEGWHVVVPFLGGFGSGTDTFIFFPEDMPTHWMPIPTAPTNTEVGE